MVFKCMCMTKSLKCPSSADSLFLNSRFLYPVAYSIIMLVHRLHVSYWMAKLTFPKTCFFLQAFHLVNHSSILPSFSAPNPSRRSQLFFFLYAKAKLLINSAGSIFKIYMEFNSLSTPPLLILGSRPCLSSPCLLVSTCTPSPQVILRTASRASLWKNKPDFVTQEAYGYVNVYTWGNRLKKVK